ncbi:suppressor of glycerol defect [Savitreella phatthalungensis]
MPSRGGPRLPGTLRDELGVARTRFNHVGRSHHSRAAASEKGIDRARRRFANRASQTEDGVERKRVRLYSGPSEDNEELEEVYSQQKNGKKEKKKQSKRTQPRPSLNTQLDVRLAQDDAEIDYWEAKLGTRDDKPYHHELDDDGLDDLFDGLDLPRGKSKLERLDGRNAGESDDDGDEDDDEADLSDDFAGFDEDDDDDGDDSVNEEEPVKAAPAPKPSPYVPPNSQAGASVISDMPKAYVPPALRKQQSGAAGNSALDRAVRGLFNRLSAANASTIVSELVNLYGNNPRGTMNETLVNVLLTIVADKSGLLDQFVVVHAAVVAALYRLGQVELAASLIQQLVLCIVPDYADRRAINLTSFLTELYNLHVVAVPLMYDLVRDLVANLDELRVEGLLVIVRGGGSQMRSDDPTSLKEVVALVRARMNELTETKGKDAVSSRAAFFVEQLNQLKNNKLSESQSLKELRTRLRKFIGGLTPPSSSAGASAEPLRVTLDDIQNIDSRGKWWLVGASYKHSHETRRKVIDQVDGAAIDHNGLSSVDSEDDAPKATTDQVAHKLRINHPVRKQVFATIMSSRDYQECASMLSSIRLKRSQEPEIIRTIVLLCAQERSYNPFYTHLALLLAPKHGMRMALQFCLWDFLRNDLGEEDVFQIGADASNGAGTEKGPALMRKVINLGKFFGHLMARRQLPITALKTLTFARMSSETTTFVDLMLCQIFLISATATASSSSSPSKKHTRKRPGSGHYSDDDADEEEAARSRRGIFEDLTGDKAVIAIFAPLAAGGGLTDYAILQRGIDAALKRVVASAAQYTAGGTPEDTAIVKNGAKLARAALASKA